MRDRLSFPRRQRDRLTVRSGGVHLPLSAVRESRIKVEPDAGDAFYHIYNRIVAGEMLLKDPEKEVLRRMVWLVAERCGIQIITYQVMTNHLHIVAYAPKRESLPDAELLRRYRLLHTGFTWWEREHLAELERMLMAGGDQAEAWRVGERRKMCNISEFMKLLKQRFSIWYNRAHDRFGTLWAERFQSSLLQSGQALLRVMAYVDRNAVRAKMCSDPKDYRFGGYGEAVAGNRLARSGIMRGLGCDDWQEAHARYRLMVLAGLPDLLEPGEPESEVIPGLAAQLARRCRFFTTGAVLGSQAFVTEHIAEYRRRTGRGSRTEPRTSLELGEGLTVMRRLFPAPA